MIGWRPDIVHVQYPTQGYDGAALPALLPVLAWQAGAVPVQTWHEAFSGRRSLHFLLQSVAPGPAIVVRPNFADLMWRPLQPIVRRRAPTMIAGASSIPRSLLDPRARADLGRRYKGGRERLVVFFGFAYPAKGVDQLFAIANPVRDAIVIAGEIDADPDYAARIRALAQSSSWAGHATITGYLPVKDVADLLATADVVVLPFVNGGGSWNSSISAAVLQGTPVVTTARERHGLNADGQVYFATPNDLGDLQFGMSRVNRLAAPDWNLGNDWQRIAREHLAVYQAALSAGHGGRSA